MGSTTTFMFSLEFLLFMESMRQQPKESQSMDQQYFERKDTATAIGTYSAFQSFFTMLASSMADLIWYQFGADIFIVTAFASILMVFILFS
jgi:hypothetical protein